MERPQTDDKGKQGHGEGVQSLPRSQMLCGIQLWARHLTALN